MVQDAADTNDTELLRFLKSLVGDPRLDQDIIGELIMLAQQGKLRGDHILRSLEPLRKRSGGK